MENINISFTPEQLKQFKPIFEIVLKAIKKAYELLCKICKKIAEKVIEFENIRRRSLGYKKKAKKKELDYYRSIAANKSNNWRKYHGLPLRRARSQIQEEYKWDGFC